jgi:sugar lactone lactonase YvrE
MNQLVGIAISAVDDSVYVADNENHRVLVFTAGGEYLTSLGDGYGTDPGNFFCPCGVALYVHPVHGQLVIVSEWGGGRVQVFRPDGRLFALYGGVDHAHHVVVDAEGTIYVSEYSARKIKKFSLTGELLGGKEWGSSAVSLVAGKDGVDSVVMPNQVVLVWGEGKKRKTQSV